MAQPSASNPPFRRPRLFFGGRGEGPLEALSAPPQGWGRAGGVALHGAGASGCSRMGKSLHGQADIEDNVVSSLADLEGAALGVSPQQSGFNPSTQPSLSDEGRLVGECKAAEAAEFWGPDIGCCISGT